LILGGLLLGTRASVATKPCPEQACYLNTTFNPVACERSASWIAVGKIVRVVDHPTGEPTFKNFAELTLQVERWEKGKPKAAPKQISFRVGWCKNARVVPEDPNERRATMRFYGAGSPTAAEPEYLWFEPLSK